MKDKTVTGIAFQMCFQFLSDGLHHRHRGFRRSSFGVFHNNVVHDSALNIQHALLFIVIFPLQSFDFFQSQSSEHRDHAGCSYCVEFFNLQDLHQLPDLLHCVGVCVDILPCYYHCVPYRIEINQTVANRRTECAAEEVSNVAIRGCSPDIVAVFRNQCLEHFVDVGSSNTAELHVGKKVLDDGVVTLVRLKSDPPNWTTISTEP